MAAPRVTRTLAYLWVGLLAVLVAGPALMPGFALSYDLVFTPRQDLLPGSIGVGSGLPRAVPQDAIVAIVETLIPGMIVEKLVLLGIPLIVGFGMLRLLKGTASGVVAATIAIANPFVAQRLVIGHWGLLLAYALVPWALVVARRLRAGGDPWDGLRLLLLVAAGSLTPSGSLLIAAVAVPPVLLSGSRYAVRSRLMLAAGVMATWLPWLLPALLHPAVASADPRGTGVFALRPDAPGGAIVTALTGGGIWNAEAVLPSRGTPLTWIFAAVVLARGAWGAGPLTRALGRGIVGWWGVVAVMGLLAAVASAMVPGAWAALVDVMPGGGLARDAQKLLAPWTLLLAASAGAGAGRLLLRVRDDASRAVVLVALAVLPLACQPDLLWGAGGRLQAVAYPGDWAAVRAEIAASERPGDIASFPWTAFRRFDWNAGRTVLDPAPRWLPRTTVVSDDLAIETADGLVVVAGDDPRSRAVTGAVAAGDSVARELPRLGVGWALLAKGTSGPIPDLQGWDRVFDGPDLALYAAPAGSVIASRPDPRGVAAVDLAVLVALLAGWGAILIRRVRARGARPLVP